MGESFDCGGRTTASAPDEVEIDMRHEIEIETERRRSPRSPLVVRVAYATVDALFTEFTRNVNEGGLFIETNAPPPLETRVALEFSLPGRDTPIRARGRVAWIRLASPEEGPAGMGVEFEQLGIEARESIDALVRQLRSSGK
ncbi:TIGR02266 family protein [Myxococcota bacterium]|nr:TIGR02266 family protein [Myxococcota bacterium]MCZ7617153.1 TIGR02266 family protein [Myxococcota bacterium]